MLVDSWSGGPGSVTALQLLHHGEIRLTARVLQASDQTHSAIGKITTVSSQPLTVTLPATHMKVDNPPLFGIRISWSSELVLRMSTEPEFSNAG